MNSNSRGKRLVCDRTRDQVQCSVQTRQPLRYKTENSICPVSPLARATSIRKLRKSRMAKEFRADRALGKKSVSSFLSLISQ